LDLALELAAVPRPAVVDPRLVRVPLSADNPESGIDLASVDNPV
jgi:hypothetical protein